MESRILLIFDNLEKVMTDTQEMCQRVETEPQSLQDLLKKKFLLKRSLDQVVSDIHKCIDQGLVSSDLIAKGTKLQLSAEETLATIEAIVTVSQTQFKMSENSSYDKSDINSKLPKIELPKFSGDLLKWHEFWDRFESTVHKRNINEADKLAYLIGCLEGHALQCVQGLATTNANYEIALNTLQTRYGKMDLLVDAHYKALYNLTPATDAPSECRKTLNTIERHLRILSSLGEEIDGNHLRIILLQKFPSSIIYECNLAARDNTVKSLRANLEHVITAKEQANCSSVTQISEVCEKPIQTCTTEALLSVNQDLKNKLKRNFNQHKPKQAMNRKRKFMNVAENKQKRKKLACIFCEGNHYNSECTEYKTLTDRKKKLNKKCYRCFREGHNIKDCKLKRSCFYCKKSDHNQALCPRKGTVETRILDTYEPSQTFNNYSFLQTAITMVKNHNNSLSCRLLLDSGSQRSYISKQVADKLKLIPDNEDYLVIYTFGSNKPKETCCPTAEIIIQTKRGIQREIRVNIVPFIIEKISVPNIDIKGIVDITADDGSLGERIDVLIGNDYYLTFMRTEKVNLKENLFIVDSEFGWVVSGINKSEENRENVLSVVTYCKCDESYFPYFTEPDLPLRDTDITFLWALESIGITDSTKTTREDEAVQHFNSTVKYEGRRYQVKWPWTQYPPDLPTNYRLAAGRLANLVRRLDQNTLQEYDLILREQQENGVIEVIQPSVEDLNNKVVPPVHYLPHHIIKQEGKKGRIVYDASARTKTQKSLNECMYRGPSMIEDLTALLLNFRTHKVAISADVEKAFLQIGLQPEDRDVTRCLWLKDVAKGTAEDNIQHLRFCRVPFGIISSPFLLTATIRYHLSKKDDNDIKEMANKFYVDNLVTGTSSSEKAKEMYQKIRKVFQELCMNIREWISNDPEFLQTIAKVNQAKKADTVKVLGLLWYVEEDILKIKLKENVSLEDCKNKRDVLRKIASFFDPCGFASPLILPAKLLMQELWLRKVNWNSPLPEDLKEKWLSVVKDLQDIKNVEIPRYIGSNIEINKETTFELHCFTDASEKAYAAVVYLRIVGSDIKTVFIMSKSRVTPIKQKENLKIPRLELLGFTIGNQLLSYIRKALELPISKQYLWTDSTIVLCWVKSNKLLDPFVSRRVNEIKQSKNTEWRYVNSSENPADIATRPGTWCQKKELWLYGPKFLTEMERSWPSATENTTLCAAGEALVTSLPEEGVELDKEPGNSRTIPDNRTEGITDDIRTLKKLQLQYFPEEVEGKQTDLSRNLQLFMDVDGLLRCKGRMGHTTWDYDKKHPVLLPSDCEFTNQLIMDTHVKNYHVGVSHTLSIIRQLYWIPKGRSQVQKVIRKCPRCVKQGGGPYGLPPMPDLPPERVNYSAPFTYTGIDYFGPLYVQSAIGIEKRWVCFMTCLAVRAVHMEVVADLTTQECLQALRRFIASRGVPTMIVSDNALQFKLSSEILENSYCIHNNIKWKFIPQLAPWHGGFYERLIGLVKHCLRRTLDKHILTDCQLLTVIKEIEAVLNTRPLTYVGPEPIYILKPADFLSLGKCITTEPSDNICSNATITRQDIIEGWKRGNVIVEEYKKMFVNQYLLSLRERYNYVVRQPRTKSEKTPTIGDVVQIKSDSKNRDNWKVGKIVSLVKGTDGECRVAKVKVGDSELIRSIGQLYPLEMEEQRIEPVQIQPSSNLEVPQNRQLQQLHQPLQNISPNETRNSVEPDEETIRDSEDNDTNIDLGQTNKNTEVRQKRKAAVTARQKIAEWTTHLAVALAAVGSVANERDPQ